MLITTVFVLTIFFLGYHIFLKPFWLLRNVPSVRPWYPLVGNMFLLLGQTGEKVFDLISSMFTQHDRMFLVWLGLKPVVGVCHPDLIRKVLTSGACLDKPFFYRFSRIDHGLWAARAPLWRGQRKALNSIFSSVMIKYFLPTFETFSKRLVTELIHHNGTAVNFIPIALRCTLRMICRTTMGIDEKDEADIVQFVANMDEITGIVSKRFFSAHLHPEIVYQMTSMYKREIELRRKCSNYTMKILNDNQRQTDTEKRISQKFFIEQLLDGNELGRSFSNTEIVQNTYTMLAAGSETNGCTIAHACLLLAMFPDIQKKVYNEVIMHFSEETEPITASTLAELTYMEAFLKECLRLYPVAPYIARESTTTIELDGIMFPRGSIFLINFFVLHRREAFWGTDSDKFEPERFLDGRVDDQHTFCYLPFSGGPRNCIGHRYAMMSLKVMLIYLVRSFKIETQLRYEEVRFKFGMLLELSSECLLQFNKR